jgi:hypothetical protein
MIPAGESGTPVGKVGAAVGKEVWLVNESEGGKEGTPAGGVGKAPGSPPGGFPPPPPSPSFTVPFPLLLGVVGKNGKLVGNSGVLMFKGGRVDKVDISAGLSVEAAVVLLLGVIGGKVLIEGKVHEGKAGKGVD